jgi:hypothetical protein
MRDTSSDICLDQTKVGWETRVGKGIDRIDTTDLCLGILEGNLLFEGRVYGDGCMCEQGGENTMPIHCIMDGGWTYSSPTSIIASNIENRSRIATGGKPVSAKDMPEEAMGELITITGWIGRGIMHA